jgi:thiamine biosynthesis lipoprotein
MSMGCAYAIVAYGDDGVALPRIVGAAFDEVDRIDRLMSHYKPESPLSRLNREAAHGPVAVEPELFGFIAEALRYARESGGAFDITVGPLMKAWGFFRSGGRVPGEAELAEVRTRVGYRHVILDPRAKTVRFGRPGLELDLGGIAKGYAVDRVVDVLRRGGVDAALVSAGGSTIYGLGAPPGREAWDVDVEDPIDPDRVALTVALKDRALSVSGRSEKSFERDGVRYSHIMDPRTGRPVQGVLSVAVLAETGTAGDALDNAFFVQGVEGSRASIGRLPDTEALVFLPDRAARWTLVRLHGPFRR